MSRATGLVGLGIAASALLIRLASGPGPDDGPSPRRSYDDAYADVGVWGAPRGGGGLLSLFEASRGRRAAVMMDDLARAHDDDFQDDDDDALADDDDDDDAPADDDAQWRRAADPTSLVISIDGDGTLSVDGEDVDDDDLGELVAEAGRGGAEVSARVVASDDVEHARVVEVLEALRAHGITKLSIGTP